MSKHAPTLSRLAIMVGFALSCFGLLLFLWVSFGGSVPLGPKGYRLQVDFEEATQLAQQADVRISGVPVGHVVAITEAPDKGIRAEIELDERYAPLPRDAQATLRQKTLLGETFVELTPGTRDGPKVPEGGTLPAGNVRPTVELDEVTRSLDAKTRASLQVVVRELARGTRHRGPAISDAMGELRPSATAYNDTLGVLSAQREAITRLLRDGGTVLGALGERRVETQRLVHGLEDVVDVTARRERDVVRTIEALPPFLSELRATIGVADRETARIADVVSSLRQAAPLVPPALRDVVAALPQVRGLLRDADPAIRAARPGVPALTGVLRAAPPLMDALHHTARDLAPAVDYLHAYRREIMAPFMNVAAATQDTFQSPGAEQPLHYLRVLIPLTGEGAVDKPRRLPTNRHNAYFRPRALDRLKEGLESFDCRHLDNPQTSFVAGSAPRACVPQAPWRLNDRPPSAYQRLERSAP